MRRKTKDFEKIMRSIIQTIYTTNNISDDFCNEYPEQLAECVERQFISGVVCGRSMANTLHFTIQNPTVTYKGLDFLENKHPNRKSNITLFVSIVAIILSGLSVAVAFLSNYESILSTLSSWFGSGSSPIQ